MGERIQTPSSTECLVTPLAVSLLSLSGEWRLGRPCTAVILPLGCAGPGSRRQTHVTSGARWKLTRASLPVLITTGPFSWCRRLMGPGPRPWTDLATGPCPSGPSWAGRRSFLTGLHVGSPGHAASHPPRTSVLWPVPLPVKFVHQAHWHRSKSSGSTHP